MNPDPEASPGYSVSNFAGADIQTISPESGGQEIFGIARHFQLSTGSSLWGDYAIASFSQPLVPGEVLNVTLTGTWSSAVFDSSRVTSLNVFWGSDESFEYSSGTITGGVPLGTMIPVNGAVVPEPHAAWLAGLGSAVALLTRRRRQQR